MALEQRILVLCDPEEDYVQRMSAYMRKEKMFPWTVHAYTRVSQMCEGLQDEYVDLLVVSEEVYCDRLQKLKAGQTVVLNETGRIKNEKVNIVNKYQAAGDVIHKLMELCMTETPNVMHKSDKDTKARLIGLYSPVKRCLQTSFGLCYGKILSQRGKTLYISFEQYSGVEELGEKSGVDLSSLLYYLQEDDYFVAKTKGVIKCNGNLDYVETMANGQNLLMISCEEWKRLLWKLQSLLDYDYIILDLSESVQGLFEILRMCTRVYTLAKDDPVAKRKIDQYEQLLAVMQYEDVKEKTNIYKLPLFRSIPLSIEQATKGDLADYVRNLVNKEGWL